MEFRTTVRVEMIDSEGLRVGVHEHTISRSHPGEEIRYGEHVEHDAGIVTEMVSQAVAGIYGEPTPEQRERQAAYIARFRPGVVGNLVVGVDPPPEYGAAFRRGGLGGER